MKQEIGELMTRSQETSTALRDIKRGERDLPSELDMRGDTIEMLHSDLAMSKDNTARLQS
jgi:hypothetical protein